MKDFFKILNEELEKETKEGFHIDIETETVENSNYRKVLFTAPNIQLVLMSLGANEDIGEETHPDTDQFIRIDEGSGKAIVGETEYELKDGSAIIIPRGKKHNIIASGEGIKLYTIYSPPHHEEDEVIENKKDEPEGK